MEPFSSILRTIARGKQGSRDLTRMQARQAMAALISGHVKPIQIGAFLIGMRMKGESVEELVGFVEAARESLGHAHPIPPNAVDLPCYAGKRRAPPLHLLAALRAREKGIPVFVHGPRTIPGRLSAWETLRACGIPEASDLKEAAAMLWNEGIAYLSLDRISSALAHLFETRSLLGVRSCIHTVLRLLNPLRCQGMACGYFHPPYGPKMIQALRLLGDKRALVFMGAEGEAELSPDRQKQLFALHEEIIATASFPAVSCRPYPKSPKEKDALLRDVLRIQQGGEDERESLAMLRMQEAFRWLAEGTSPKGWRFSVCASIGEAGRS